MEMSTIEFYGVVHALEGRPRFDVRKEVRGLMRSLRSAMKKADTCRKQKISFFHYIKDRLTQTQQLPSLAELIQKKSRLARAPT